MAKETIESLQIKANKLNEYHLILEAKRKNLNRRDRIFLKQIDFYNEEARIHNKKVDINLYKFDRLGFIME